MKPLIARRLGLLGLTLDDIDVSNSDSRSDVKKVSDSIVCFLFVSSSRFQSFSIEILNTKRW